jgi:hypothetical protein
MRNPLAGMLEISILARVAHSQEGIMLRILALASCLFGQVSQADEVTILMDRSDSTRYIQGHIELVFDAARFYAASDISYQVITWNDFAQQSLPWNPNRAFAEIGMTPSGHGTKLGEAMEYWLDPAHDSVRTQYCRWGIVIIDGATADSAAFQHQLQKLTDYDTLFVLVTNANETRRVDAVDWFQKQYTDADYFVDVYSVASLAAAFGYFNEATCYFLM